MINQQKDWQDWSDCLIFREELRAIGYTMSALGDALCILDFGSFTLVLENDPDGTDAARGFVQAALFFECLKRDQDFRLTWMCMLVVYLTDLMEHLAA